MNHNEILDLKHPDNTFQEDDKLLQIFQRFHENESYFEQVNFQSLLITFIIWIKRNQEYISIELSDQYNEIKISIKKLIGLEELWFFTKIFEELALYKIHFIDNSLTENWEASLTLST